MRVCFRKVNGVFTLPDLFDDDTSPRLYAEILDTCFFRNRIDSYFKVKTNSFLVIYFYIIKK
jgi:hypothetical protein